MSCKSVRKQLIDFLDAGSTGSPPNDVTAHLESCPDCARYYDEARRTLSALHPQDEVRTSNDFKERVMNQIYTAHTLECNTKLNRSGAWFLKPLWAMGLAAILILGFLAIDLFSPSPSQNNDAISVPGLLSQAWANERDLFEQDGVVHLVNQILVPATDNKALAQARWFPMLTLDENGQPHTNQLSLPTEPGKGYTVLDEVWYDPAQKRYIRRIHSNGQTVFAASFDGETLYSIQTGEDGKSTVVGAPISDRFKAPETPIEFLGIYPGFSSLIDENNETQVTFFEDAKLEDGTEVRVVKAVTPQPENAPENFMLFKINKKDNSLTEVEWRILGSSYLVVRRLKTEFVSEPGYAWNLDNLSLSEEPQSPNARPSVQSDMVLTDVSVQHTIDKAEFETYLFKESPSWTQERVIVDVLDLPSPPKRSFIIVYKASDKRHVVLYQSHTFNQAMGAMAKQGEAIYKSTNGFTVWSTPQNQMGAKIALQSAMSVTQTPPADDCTGYILESPSGTFPAFAVNGPLSDDELHALIDCLTPAKELTE